MAFSKQSFVSFAFLLSWYIERLSFAAFSKFRRRVQSDHLVAIARLLDLWLFVDTGRDCLLWVWLNREQIFAFAALKVDKEGACDLGELGAAKVKIVVASEEDQA